MDVDSVDEESPGTWRLWVATSPSNEPEQVDDENGPSLEFEVANGHLPVATGVDRGREGVLMAAQSIGIDDVKGITWPEGARAVIFEMNVPRDQSRQLRVAGPNGLAWALFDAGADGNWRARGTAKAVGFSGTSQIKLRAGVWAIVLFQESAAMSGGSVEFAFEDEDVKVVPAFRADAHELRRFVLGGLLFAAALSLGEAGRVYLISGNVWTSWVTWPIGTMFLLFPVSFAISTVYHCFYSMPVLRGEKGFRSASFANRPIKVKGMKWPSVTIQIPVFREPFEEVIRPTLDSARRAAERYRSRTGAECNVLVCDDGLLCFADNNLDAALANASSTPPDARSTAQSEVLARTAYYERSGVAFVARPWPKRGVPGTERAGRFRKASNLNYALRLADRLESSEPLSEAHAAFRSTLSGREFALGVSRGDVRVGEIIVQLDKDSVMPLDVIEATVPEFAADPTLAYTQHSTYPTNEDRYFSAMVGWFTRLLFNLAISSKCLVAGSMTPMLGHNLFLRRADVYRAGGWHEHSVCEDLQLMLRLYEAGRHGKYVCYPGHDFGEAVTRVYSEEVEKFRRYAFGAVEAVINPVTEWERYGIVKESWRQFCRSEHVRWYQILELFQFFFSLINIASIIPFAVLTGLGIVHPYAALTMGVISLTVFSVVSLPAIYLLRRRGGLAAMPASRVWRTRFAPLKATLLQLALGITFIGYSTAVLSGALAHLFNRPLVFAETSADSLGQLTRRAHLRSAAMRKALRDAAWLVALCGVLIVWQVYLYSLPLEPGTKPLDWRYHAVWLYPLVLTALAPFIYHPYLIGGPDRRRRAAQVRPSPVPA